jgi:hypothetical protein
MRSSERHQEVIRRSSGGHQEVIERSSGGTHGSHLAPYHLLIRGHQRSSEVIRGHQRSSEVII